MPPVIMANAFALLELSSDEIDEMATSEAVADAPHSAEILSFVPLDLGKT